MKQRLYTLLMVEHRAMLDDCYQQVFFEDGTATIKTFEDCLTDFYLYLLDAKPKYVTDETEGYYLQQVRDEKALPNWLWKTFRNFLLEEHKVIVAMQKALKEYNQQRVVNANTSTIDLTLMHVAFSLAWFNEHETEVDRYLFFRSAYKHFSGFYAWPAEDLDDKEVARILGLSYDNARQRTSRLCLKVRKLVQELNNAQIASLKKSSLDIAESIYLEPEPDIESILEELIDKAERDLPQYAQIIELRQQKRKSKDLLERLHLERMEERMAQCCHFELCEPSIAPMFENCLSDAEPKPMSIPSAQQRIVSKFMSFINNQ